MHIYTPYNHTCIQFNFFHAKSNFKVHSIYIYMYLLLHHNVYNSKNILLFLQKKIGKYFFRCWLIYITGTPSYIGQSPLARDKRRILSEDTLSEPEPISEQVQPQIKKDITEITKDTGMHFL